MNVTKMNMTIKDIYNKLIDSDIYILYLFLLKVDNKLPFIYSINNNNYYFNGEPGIVEFNSFKKKEKIIIFYNYLVRKIVCNVIINTSFKNKVLSFLNINKKFPIILGKSFNETYNIIYANHYLSKLDMFRYLYYIKECFHIKIDYSKYISEYNFIGLNFNSIDLNYIKIYNKINIDIKLGNEIKSCLGKNCFYYFYNFIDKGYINYKFFKNGDIIKKYHFSTYESSLYLTKNVISFLYTIGFKDLESYLNQKVIALGIENNICDIYLDLKFNK